MQTFLACVWETYGAGQENSLHRVTEKASAKELLKKEKEAKHNEFISIKKKFEPKALVIEEREFWLIIQWLEESKKARKSLLIEHRPC